MSTARQRMGFAGVTKLRRKLRRMDKSITQGVRSEIEAAAKSIEMDMLVMAPVDEGDLARSISYKIGKDGMTALIGPAARSTQIKRGLKSGPTKYTKSGRLTAATIRNKKARFELYKAMWLEFGTSNMAARPFIQPAYDANKDEFTKRVRNAVSAALEEGASG